MSQDSDSQWEGRFFELSVLVPDWAEFELYNFSYFRTDFSIFRMKTNYWFPIGIGYLAPVEVAAGN